MAKKVDVLFSNKIGRGYSSTTAHGTKVNGFVFVTGQVAVKPGQDGLKERDRVEIPRVREIDVPLGHVLEGRPSLL